MALADLLGAIYAETEAEIGRIAQQTGASIAEIRSAAEVETETIRGRRRRGMTIPLQQERARRLNRARLTALRLTAHAREQFFAEALAGARERLASARNEADYPSRLEALAEETLANIKEEAVLRADPRDEAILRALLPHTRMEFDLQTWGGVEARTLDGRIVLLNTLETRLQQAQETLRQEVIGLLEKPTDVWANMTMPMLGCAR